MAYYSPASTIHGDAPVNILSDDVCQIYNDTCFIKSRQLMLQDFGINLSLSEDQLCHETYVKGWYNDGGINPAYNRRFS